VSWKVIGLSTETDTSANRYTKHASNGRNPYELTIVGIAALLLILLVGASMVTIVSQLADVADPERQILFGRNVLALTILVTFGAFAMRRSTVTTLTSPSARSLRGINLLVPALLVCLLIALGTAFLSLNDISLNNLLGSQLAQLGAWYALLVMAGITVFLLLNHRDMLHFSDGALRDKDDQIAQLFQETERLNELLREAVSHNQPTTDTIAVKSIGRLDYVKVADIHWISSARNYIEIHCGGAVYTHRESLKSILRRLEPAGFVQVHRSAALNLRHIKRFERQDDDKAVARLRDGTSVPVSRSYRGVLLSALDKTNGTEKACLGPLQSPLSSQNA